MKQTLLKIVNDASVTKAEPVMQSAIVYNTIFRDICAKNSCGCYGQCYMCPPDAGPIDELISKAQGYSNGILYQNVYTIEDPFDIEGMFEAKRKHHRCAQQIHQSVKQMFSGADILHLEAGGCGICERCAKRDQLPCRFPDRALSSLESYGIDVYHTASNAGLKYVNGSNTITYFGLLLFQEDLNA